MFEYLALIVDLIIDLKLACFLLLFILRSPEQVNRIMANFYHFYHPQFVSCHAFAMCIADTYIYCEYSLYCPRERTNEK